MVILVTRYPLSLPSLIVTSAFDTTSRHDPVSRTYQIKTNMFQILLVNFKEKDETNVKLTSFPYIYIHTNEAFFKNVYSSSLSLFSPSLYC